MDKETLRGLMSELGRRRAKKLTAEERSSIASQGGKARWAEMTPQDRSAEMKRRAEVRAEKKKRAKEKDGKKTAKR